MLWEFMCSTIATLDPVTGSRGLLVEVHPDLTQASTDVRRAFVERMFVRNVRVGLIVCSTETLVPRLGKALPLKNSLTGLVFSASSANQPLFGQEGVDFAPRSRTVVVTATHRDEARVLGRLVQLRPMLMRNHSVGHPMEDE